MHICPNCMFVGLATLPVIGQLFWYLVDKEKHVRCYAKRISDGGYETRTLQVLTGPKKEQIPDRE